LNSEIFLGETRGLKIDSILESYKALLDRADMKN